MNTNDALDFEVTDLDATDLDVTAFDEPADVQRLVALHDNLADRAEAAGDLDVAYRFLESPIGRLLIAATPAGVCRVAFEVERHDAVVQDLAQRIGPRILHAPAKLDDVARDLDAYFAGAARDLGTRIDLRLASGFRRTVLERLALVRYGERIGYGQLARAVGNPGAARAVGSACATNPLPLVLPCHRVVRGDGTFGAYRGGPAAKRFLLEFEAAHRDDGADQAE